MIEKQAKFVSPVFFITLTQFIIIIQLNMLFQCKRHIIKNTINFWNLWFFMRNQDMNKIYATVKMVIE